MVEKYSISQFSRLIGISIDTLRYYEQLGLISPRRNSSNQRYYMDDDINWIQFIIRLKRTGMKIKDIQQYSNLRAQGNKTILIRLQLLHTQLAELYEQQRRLEDNIEFLTKKIDVYNKMINN